MYLIIELFPVLCFSINLTYLISFHTWNSGWTTEIYSEELCK